MDDLPEPWRCPHEGNFALSHRTKSGRSKVIGCAHCGCWMLTVLRDHEGARPQIFHGIDLLAMVAAMEEAGASLGIDPEGLELIETAQRVKLGLMETFDGQEG